MKNITVFYYKNTLFTLCKCKGVFITFLGQYNNVKNACSTALLQTNESQNRDISEEFLPPAAWCC